MKKWKAKESQCFDFGLKEGKIHSRDVVQGGEKPEGLQLER